MMVDLAPGMPPLPEFISAENERRKFMTKNDPLPDIVRCSWYPVRCCCQPHKIFGFLKLPDSSKSTHTIADRSGSEHIVELRPIRELRRVDDPQTAGAYVDAVYDAVCSDEERAVYSDDRPIEFWRTISGFVEVVSRRT